MKRSSSVIIDIVEDIEMREKLRQLEDLFESLSESEKESKAQKSKQSKKEKKEKKHHKRQKKGKATKKHTKEVDFTGIFAKIMNIIDSGEPRCDSSDTPTKSQHLDHDDDSHTSATDECSFSSTEYTPREAPTVGILRKREHRAGPKRRCSQTSFCIEKNECHFIPPTRSESLPDLFYSWEEIETFREDMMEEIRSEQFLFQMRGGNTEEE